MSEREKTASEWAAWFWAAREVILDSDVLADMESPDGQEALMHLQEADNQLVDLIPDLLEEIATLKNELVRKEFQS